MKQYNDRLDKIKVLSLTNDGLRSSIDRYLVKIKDQSSWHMPFGVSASFVSAWVSMVVSNKEINEYNLWINIKYLSLYAPALMFGVWALILFVKNMINKSAKEFFIDSIIDQITNKPNTTYIFLVTRLISGQVEFLVHFHEIRKCYFLPYWKRRFDDTCAGLLESHNALINEIADRFSWSGEDFEINNIDNSSGLFENKYFPNEQLIRTVYFQFHIINVCSDEIRNTLNNCGDINAVSYEWKTLEIMKDDVITYDNNKVVIDFLKTNISQISSSMKHVNEQ